MARDGTNLISQAEALRLLEIEEEQIIIELEIRNRGGAVEKFVDKYETWREYPDIYALERLGVTLTSAQIQILYSVKENRRTAVKAHHALGKTFVAAVALLWWIDCWTEHIGYITAPSWEAALGKTFKHAKRLAIKNRLPFQILNSGIIRSKDAFKATERFIQALNADKGESFQGEHTAEMLLVFDEAIGVKPFIYDAARGLMTSAGNRQLEIGNPTDEATSFGSNCESPNYNVLSFSALDDLNVLAELKGETVLFKGGVSLQWLLEEFIEHTEVSEKLDVTCFEFYTIEVMQNALNGIFVDENSPKCFYKPTGYFQGRVLGEFPTEASNKVIPSGWLKSLPLLEINLGHKIQVGCDVARFGEDRTTIFARIGGCVIFGKAIRKFDGVAVADAIRDCVETIANQYSTAEKKIDAKQIEIAIDSTGGIGTTPLDILKNEGYKVIGINSSAKAIDTELYKNKRSELWFHTRSRVQDKRMDLSRLDLDLKRLLIKELATPMYEVRVGKRVVEEKDAIKKRLKASPDLADGLNLAFYEVHQSSGVMMMDFRV